MNGVYYNMSEKYNIDYLKNNFNLNNRIVFEYQNSFVTIGRQEVETTKDKCVKFYIAIDKKFDEMEFMLFDTIDELFENVSIEGNRLKEIWTDVDITTVEGFDEC